MTSREFSKALTHLGITQMGFAEIIGVNERTVRNWVGGRSDVPTSIAVLLHLMLDTKSTAEDLRA
jgi:plasmid maintenance system antidote protein VapI